MSDVESFLSTIAKIAQRCSKYKEHEAKYNVLKKHMLMGE